MDWPQAALEDLVMTDGVVGVLIITRKGHVLGRVLLNGGEAFIVGQQALKLLASTTTTSDVIGLGGVRTMHVRGKRGSTLIVHANDMAVVALALNVPNLDVPGLMERMADMIGSPVT